MAAVSPEIIAVVRYTQHGNYTPQRIDGTTEGREVEPLRWVVDGMYSSSRCGIRDPSPSRLEGPLATRGTLASGLARGICLEATSNVPEAESYCHKIKF